MGTSIAQDAWVRALSHPKGEGELKPCVWVLEPGAEQLAQLAKAVADGLGVHVELRCHGLHLARTVEPGA